MWSAFELWCCWLQEVFHHFEIIRNGCRGLFKAFHLTWLSCCYCLSIWWWVPTACLWFSMLIADKSIIWCWIASSPHLCPLRWTWNDNLGIASALKLSFTTIDTFLIWWVTSCLISHIWVSTILVEVNAACEEAWLCEHLRELVFCLSIRYKAGRKASCDVSLLVSAFYNSWSVPWNRTWLLRLMPVIQGLRHIWISTDLLFDLALLNGYFIDCIIYCLHVNSVVLSTNIIVVLMHDLWKVCTSTYLRSLLIWDRFVNAWVHWISYFSKITNISADIASSDFVITF